MKHPDGSPWNEKAPIILPDTTLKARFLNDTLTDEDHSHILTLIERDTAMKPEMTPALGYARGMFEVKCTACNRNLGWCEKPDQYNDYCHRCGQKLEVEG